MKNDMRRLMRDPKLLPSEKQNLLSRIADQAGTMNLPCYLVGGFVRDLLLGRPVNDFDIVVEGDAIKLGQALVRLYGGTLTTHSKFHTAVWHMITSDTLDLITARAETYSHPGALPTVKPSTIDDDLRRRDFTINAMAVRLDGDHFGELLDPLAGQNDLRHKSICCLHPWSFMDDPTRIFRAIRYEQRYAFQLDSETSELIDPEAFAVLKELSAKRIRHEFDLIFEEENAGRMLARLHELGVFEAFDPPLPIFDPKYMSMIDANPPEDFGVSITRVELGYLLWLIDSQVETVEAISKRLVFTSALSESAISLVQLKSGLSSLKEARPSEWTFHLEKFPLNAVYVLWLVSNISALKEFLVNWRHVKPALTGDDLQSRGVPSGPRYKEILSKLRAARLDGELRSRDDELRLLEAWIK
jgi:tRNA nucleotidyltransferase (CCA-adding enzyme)